MSASKLVATRPDHGSGGGALEIRRSTSRGVERAGWLDARFSFSFAGYRDPARDRFGPLLALNEDRVQPSSGFPMHPHRDLEIVMIPWSGMIEHRDSLGGRAVLAPGEVQLMRAGSGIRHSQMNPSPSETDHHFQLWIEPDTRGLTPAVMQRRFGLPVTGAWTTLAHPATAAAALAQAGDEHLAASAASTEPLPLRQDAWLRWGRATPQRPLALEPRPGRSRYVHVIEGAGTVRKGVATWSLEAGDAIIVRDDAGTLAFSGAGAGIVVLEVDVPLPRP